MGGERSCAPYIFHYIYNYIFFNQCVTSSAAPTVSLCSKIKGTTCLPASSLGLVPCFPCLGELN